MIPLFEQEEAVRRYGISMWLEGYNEGYAELSVKAVKHIIASGGTVETAVQMLGLPKSEVQRICDEG